MNVNTNSWQYKNAPPSKVNNAILVCYFFGEKEFINYSLEYLEHRFFPWSNRKHLVID